jgi:hypothetical protein
MKRSKCSKRSQNEEWTKYKPHLKERYVTQGMTLPQVMEAMEREYGFTAT